ncbi:hypothetical protein NC653_026107 [Populus alba x Populus x berolinensis]|uniref:Uncharacterized protein n=1 Tax=Populus alba x Populus x berolinensis TaxID=444605 RepID=A0AAD6MCV6_9ROSI|nr:hypothetical protein NC653_026107 [Populus alba x Populus x berolinensis]
MEGKGKTAHKKILVVNSASLFLISETIIVLFSNHLNQALASSVLSLEMALLILSQEADKLEGMKKSLSLLSRAIEVDPTSEALWMMYLLIYYSNIESVGKDDMFSYAVKNNNRSYGLWLVYIDSRIHLDDRLVAYNAALTALCHHASAFDRGNVYASACILDLFLQMMDCLCMSGNVGKAIQKIQGLFPVAANSDEPPSHLLSDILTCLTISDKYIFWVCCVYLVIYRKLPDAIVQRFECEKELLAIEWPSVYLQNEEKQRAVKLVEMAVDSVKVSVNSESLDSDTNVRLAQQFALCHIRCFKTNGTGGVSFKGFEGAISNWPKESPWNSFVSGINILMDGNSSHGLLELASASNPDSLTSSSNQMEIMFGLINLSLAKLLHNDHMEAHVAIDRALKAAPPQYIKHCLREHAVFLLNYGSQLTEGCPSHVVWSHSFTPKSNQPKELVDFVEAIFEIVPSNYPLAFSVCKLLCRGYSSVNVASDSVLYWVCSILVNAIFHAIPIPPEYAWVEAAGILGDISGIELISDRFYKKALSAHPFSVKLWTCYYNLSKTRGYASTVVQKARERGIQMVVSSIELVQLKRYFRPVLLIDAPGGQDLEKSKKWHETVSRMDREKPMHVEKVMRDGSEKFDATGFYSGFSEEAAPVDFESLERMLKLLDFSLRLSVIPLSVATIWLTVTNKQDNSIYGYLKYSNLSGLK